ncbi:MAG TPA: glutathione peroxidase [Pyrinomonadaceae bacterium]|nr:glutathione peroxidase [Pyrinomonadaceae bacterium]
MLKGILLSCVIGAIFVAVFVCHHQQTVVAGSPSVLDFKMRDIDGKDVKLKKYKGDVLLVVNTASKCGYTPQYEGLQATFDKYKDRGFYVLGFPANNFGGQEPGTEKEIKEFCTSKYKVTFPMFAKISVKGEDQDPLYAFLTKKETNPDFAGDITWNFNKFLIDRKGKVVARFSSKDKPDGEAVTQAIEKYLAAK